MSKIYEALQLARGERARGLIPPTPEVAPADLEARTPETAAPDAPLVPEADPALVAPTDRGAERRAERRAARPIPPPRRDDVVPGILPDLPPGVLRRSGFNFEKEMASLAASLSNIEVPEGRGLVLHIMSVHAGEGTSTIARELATHLAEHARRHILLVDADDDNRAQVRHFGIGDTIGIAERHREQKVLDGAVAPIGNSMLHVATLAEDPAAITNATERTAIASLYEDLRTNYAITIVDCPPIDQAPDMLALTRHADGVLLLIEADRTRAHIAARARDMIEDAGGRVIGVVLNKRRDYIPDFLYRLL